MGGSASTTRYWDCSAGACGCGYGREPILRRMCPSGALFTPKNP